MLPLPVTSRRFYEPSDEALALLNGKKWICSYSGGKDSTSLVTWIEWLRRTGQVDVDEPRLVMSDTAVEFPFLSRIAETLMARLRDCGWKTEIVRPELNQKLYNQIFGRGLTPIYPGIRNMRWCTRATKIDPMEKFIKTLDGDYVQLSGVRWGESKMRDGKLEKRAAGCSAGGECGLPDPDKAPATRNVYGPIMNWRTCQVIDWLSGERRLDIPDLIDIVRELLHVYEIKFGPRGFGIGPPKVSALRFGCIGCPAIGRDKMTSKQLADNPQWKILRQLYVIWEKLRHRRNRLPPKRKMRLPGPIRMVARQYFFTELLDVQKQSGVCLVTDEDELYIRDCWQNKVYPRGWSVEDDLDNGPIWKG